ncbi:MAG: hypothetical protein JWM49_2037 [Microbacteriaceae bacterium]|nr:hypothetical protein [Microbacteriaceae bacterium]
MTTATTARQPVNLAARRKVKDGRADWAQRQVQIAGSIYATEVFVTVAGVLSKRKADLIFDREFDAIADALHAGTPVETVSRNLVDRYWDASLNERGCD